MDTNRRTFLKQLGAAGVVSLGCAPPAFLAKAGRAADAMPNANGRILVIVQMAGGNDGLNTVIPYGDPEYLKARPGIGIGEQAVLKINDHIGLHPQMTGFKELFDEGQLAVLQGIGYPHPNRSHFRSMDIWQSARAETEDTQDGWLGRALEGHANRNAGEVAGLALGSDKLPLALLSSKISVPTIRDPRDFHLKLGQGSAAERRLLRKSIEELAAGETSTESDLDFVRRASQTALKTSKKLEEISTSYQAAAGYPATGLAQKLKTIARLIAGDLGLRVFFVSLDGFDTHSQQAGAHQALLAELSSAIRAFFADLKGHQLDDRVLLATYSEFGRRVHENGSLGTDHGAASQMFVVSPQARGGVHGDHPSLTDLDEGDLKHHTDFREVYATLLEKWLLLPSEQALGKRFPALDLITG